MGESLRLPPTPDTNENQSAGNYPYKKRFAPQTTRPVATEATNPTVRMVSSFLSGLFVGSGVGLGLTVGSDVGSEVGSDVVTWALAMA